MVISIVAKIVINNVIASFIVLVVYADLPISDFVHSLAVIVKMDLKKTI